MTREQAERRIGAWVRFKDNHDPRGHMATARVLKVLDDKTAIVRTPGKQGERRVKLAQLNVWHSRDVEAGITDPDAEIRAVKDTGKKLGTMLVKNAVTLQREFDPTYVPASVAAQKDRPVNAPTPESNINGMLSDWLERLKTAKAELATAEQTLAEEQAAHAARVAAAKKVYDDACHASQRQVEEAERLVAAAKRGYSDTAATVRAKKQELDTLLDEALNLATTAGGDCGVEFCDASQGRMVAK